MGNKRGRFGSFKMPFPAKAVSLPDDATTEQIIDRLRADVTHEKQTFQAMGIVSTGGDVRLLAADRLQQFVNYAEVVKQKRTLEGYDIERLRLIATLLEQQSITPEDLRKLVDNLVFATEKVMEINIKALQAREG
jgi:hypothetical protein